MDAMDYSAIGLEFMTHVKTKDHWSMMKLHKQCFIASKGVDFLVKSGIAKNRHEAVIIGRELQLSKGLFDPVEGKNVLFQDKRLLFRFSSCSKRTTTDTTETGDNLPFASFVRHAAERRGTLSAEEVGRHARASIYAHEHHLDLKCLSVKELDELMPEENEVSDKVNDPFETAITPNDMRCLALVAHNHMKPAMKAFIEDHSEIIKKFRLTGTNTTMSMCKTLFGDDNPDVVYGPTCTSGPLGGDAQLCALMCLEVVGAIIFFMDPLSAHPHQADIDSLVRLANVHNIILCPNPATGHAAMWMFRNSLSSNRPEMIPSFFETLVSPCVPEYKAEQEAALAKVSGTRYVKKISL
jgi:methylglyoxal synthase